MDALLMFAMWVFASLPNAADLMLNVVSLALMAVESEEGFDDGPDFVETAAPLFSMYSALARNARESWLSQNPDHALVTATAALRIHQMMLSEITQLMRDGVTGDEAVDTTLEKHRIIHNRAAQAAGVKDADYEIDSLFAPYNADLKALLARQREAICRD